MSVSDAKNDTIDQDQKNSVTGESPRPSRLPGCCAIVEPRQHRALSFVLHNVKAALPPDWPLHIFHGRKNAEFVREAASDLEPVVFHNLYCLNLTFRAYNRLLTKPSFYRNFQEAEYVLIFQTDSMLFSHSPFAITDFFGYDYVGAPWKWHWEADPSKRGGNGGLSLRKVDSMIQTLEAHPYPRAQAVNEDLYLCNLPLSLPPTEVARRFSIESVYYPCPLGVHKPWLYLGSEEYLKLAHYAPSIKTLVDLN
jgi:hypothetical protein